MRTRCHPNTIALQLCCFAATLVLISHLHFRSCWARPSNQMTRIQEVFRTLMGGGGMGGGRPMMLSDLGGNPGGQFRGKKSILDYQRANAANPYGWILVEREESPVIATFVDDDDDA